LEKGDKKGERGGDPLLKGERKGLRVGKRGGGGNNNAGQTWFKLSGFIRLDSEELFGRSIKYTKRWSEGKEDRGGMWEGEVEET